MQPQQPSGPNPNYDFIMNSGNAPKKGLVPDLGLPKPVIYGVLGVVVLMIIIVVAAVTLGGKKGNPTSV
ncbi:MAG TPA: hypothetical protein VG964_01535, partial [Candidatus Saccharimonadales bacterium]|nr:hypothetical protein [Candidatus Saccharimonadales bacterium]